MPTPVVSICIPTFNGRDVVARAVDSALDQDYPSVEVVVIDDASTDGTPHLLRRRYGGRVRLSVQPRRRGHSRNWNASVRGASGPLIKFLHQDDWLLPNAVSRMAELFAARATVGLVFSRRRVELDEVDDDGLSWLARYGTVHTGFRDLKEINEGGALLGQLLDAGLRDNWVGEPSNVMIRRACVERLGGFSRNVRQFTDLDLWLRIFAHYDAGFVDEELAVYRHSRNSLTGLNERRSVDWLDRLWMLEGLCASPEVRRAFPVLAAMRRGERRMVSKIALRSLAGHVEAKPPIRTWARYLLVRSLIRLRLQDPFERIAPAGGPRPVLAGDSVSGASPTT